MRAVRLYFRARRCGFGLFESERGASRLESGTQIRKTFLRDGNADIDGLRWSLEGFFCVGGGVEFGGQPAVDVELYTGGVSVFSVDIFDQIQTFVGEEMSLVLVCLFQAFGELRFMTAPIVELFVWRQFRVVPQQLEQ